MAARAKSPDAPSGRTKTYDKARELALLKRFEASGDPALREEAFGRFLPLARSLAHRYSDRGERTEDLEQVACVGLLKAIDGFDPDRYSDFPAYAAPTILGELRRHFRDKTWSVRVPRSLQERSQRVTELSAGLSSELGREPTMGEIAERTGVAECELEEALEAGRARGTRSLDAPIVAGEDESVALVDTLPSEDGGFDIAESDLAVESAGLRREERAALDLRYHHGMTQREIGEEIGVSQMQVSRILKASLEKVLVAVRGEAA